MNPASIALLIVALLMASASGEVGRIDVILDGAHGIPVSSGAVIVVDGVFEVDPDMRLEGPVYVVGGRFMLEGAVTGDVVQLAGTVDIVPTGAVDGELRHIAGALDVDPGATIASRVELDVAGQPSGFGGFSSTIITATTLAGIGFVVVRRRPQSVSNVAAAAFEHPVVTFTVGCLVTLTFVALFVFMAFTLVLLPIALIGIVVGLITAILGLIALGRGLGRKLPIEREPIAAGIGVAAVVIAMQLAASIPLIGDWVVLSTVMVGIGAVIVTYFGAARLDIDALPGLDGVAAENRGLETGD